MKLLAKKSTTKELLADYKKGKMIILLDDENRENEGDLLIAANKITKEDINFMATYGRGLICLTITRERCKQLNLPLMVKQNNDIHSTNFTISIEAAKGVTTGISAADRAKTIKNAVAINAKPEDIVQPGHIFPLMAQDGGVLIRAGHTEAGCDLAKLAGFEPASVIVEILNEDGSMARLNDVQEFSKKHNIKWGTIEDIIRYRMDNEKTIERINQRQLKTQFGNFKVVSYLDKTNNDTHLVLIKGNIDKETEICVRVHVENIFTDVLGEINSGFNINKALEIIAEHKSGVFLLLRKQNNKDILDNIDNSNFDQYDDLRTFGIGAQILADLGVCKMNILRSPRVYHGLEGFGLKIINYLDFKK